MHKKQMKFKNSYNTFSFMVCRFFFNIVLYIIILEQTIRNSPWDFNAKNDQHVIPLLSAGAP